MWGCGGFPQALIPDQCVQEKLLQSLNLYASQPVAV